MSDWVKAVEISELNSGAGLVVEVLGRDIALFYEQGQIYAMDNACPHQGGPLGEGAVEGLTVRCPWHGWQFGLQDGVCALSPAFRVQCYSAEIRDEAVWLEIPS